MITRSFKKINDQWMVKDLEIRAPVYPTFLAANRGCENTGAGSAGKG